MTTEQMDATDDYWRKRLGGKAEDQVKVQLHLEIEQDESVPFPLLQIAVPDVESGPDFIRIVATNFKSDDDGARAVASLLEQTAAAIRSKLGEKAAEPKRPRFNPRPVGGQ